MTDRKFPIGPLVLQEDYTKEELKDFISVIANIAADYSRLVENLAEEDLVKTYREGSWNIRQLVHHVADIQFLHYMRMKKAVTEPDYKEVTLIDMNAWAETPDSFQAPVSVSLNMLHGVHYRYALFAQSLHEEQLAVTYFHPLRKIDISQKQALAMSVWHAQHHLAHIKLALNMLA
ncbi:DinB family protein [Dyadobacter sediminis]|uniref:DinB-like domain-containing protein n=1 Tax=Dyadobacter sediminis TaxID=1493691 RepID=A0A5R9KDH8_9BACT|nr:DinB family protein [Dyadobacter sediminis]TLU94200.1 hypothetical protein FEM55_08055 [Dyadobacter sediminis]GGB93375.1 putative metal-dependent hydrolase YfiT [Dyadobacter sediminis]